MTKESGFDSRQRQDVFLFYTAFRQALMVYSTLYTKGTGWSLPGDKGNEHENKQLPASSTMFTNAWRYPSTLPYVFM